MVMRVVVVAWLKDGVQNIKRHNNGLQEERECVW